MELTLIAVIVATGVCLAGVLVAESRSWTRGIWCFKPAASTGFIAVALLSGAAGSRYGLFILAGLCLSWLGDQLLIPKDNLATFRGGLVSFLLGHVAYAVAFGTLGPSWPVTAGAILPVAGAALLVMRWLGGNLGKMYVPVLAYILVISVMVVLAVGSYGAPGGGIRLAGAIAFYLSDLSVARDRFVAPGFSNRAWGLPLYYGSQVLLALSCAAAAPT